MAESMVAIMAMIAASVVATRSLFRGSTAPLHRGPGARSGRDHHSVSWGFPVTRRPDGFSLATAVGEQRL